MTGRRTQLREQVFALRGNFLILVLLLGAAAQVPTVTHAQQPAPLAVEAAMREVQARWLYPGRDVENAIGWPTCCGSTATPPFPPDGWFKDADEECLAAVVSELWYQVELMAGGFVRVERADLTGQGGWPTDFNYTDASDAAGAAIPFPIDETNYRDAFSLVDTAISNLRYITEAVSYTRASKGRAGPYAGDTCAEAMANFLDNSNGDWSWTNWWTDDIIVLEQHTVNQDTSHCDPPGLAALTLNYRASRLQFYADLTGKPGTGQLYIQAYLADPRDVAHSTAAVTPDDNYHLYFTVSGGQMWEQDGYLGPSADGSPTLDYGCGDYPEEDCVEGWPDDAPYFGADWALKRSIGEGPTLVFEPIYDTSPDDAYQCDAVAEFVDDYLDSNPSASALDAVCAWMQGTGVACGLQCEELPDCVEEILGRTMTDEERGDLQECSPCPENSIEDSRKITTGEPGEGDKDEKCEDSGGEGGGGAGDGTGTGGGAETKGDGERAEIVYPTDLASGIKLESEVDATVSLRDDDFVVRRMYTGSPEYTGASLVGNNWMLDCFEFIHTEVVGSDLVVTMSGPPMEKVLRLEPIGGGQWSAGGSTSQHMVQAQTTVDSVTYDVWRLVEPGRWEIDFYSEDGASSANTPDELEGLVLQRRDAHGNVRTYSYELYGPTGDKAARLISIYLDGTSEQDAAAAIRFTWYLGGLLSGKLHTLQTLRFDSTHMPFETQRVEYRYKEPGDGVSDDVGTTGDLIEVRRAVAVNRVEEGDPGSWEQMTQYRYHDDSAPGSDPDERLNASGREHQLKMVIEPEQVEYFAQQWNATETVAAESALVLGADHLLTLADTDVAYTDASTQDVRVTDLASKIISYEGDVSGSRVETQFLQTACGCGGGTTQGLKMGFEYITRPSGDPTTKITEYVHDGNDWSTVHRTIYYDMELLGPNDVPYLVNKAIVEPGVGGRRWVTRREYDSDRNLARFITASAISGYTATDETGGLDITVETETGLIYEYGYTSDNRRNQVAVKEGSSGDPIIIQKTNYPSAASASPAKRLWLPESVERYRDQTYPQSTSANDLEVTTFAYGFYTSSTTSSDLAWVKTSVEAELQAENGPDSPTTYDSYELYDEDGLNVWSAAEDLTLTFRDFDAGTGAVSQITRNADPDGSGDADALPNPWASSGNGLGTTGWGPHAADGELTTTYVHDDLGRVIQRISPGSVNSYTVREMREIESRPGILYYATISLPHRLAGATAGDTDEFDGPAVVTWMNAGSDTIGVSEYTVDGTEAYTPTPAGSFTFSFETTTGDVADPRGEIARSRVVHTVSGLVSARQVWKNITGGQGESMYEDTYEYDALGRLSQMTNDNGTITAYTVYDVLSRVLEVKVGTDSTNLKTIGQYFYDDPNPNDGTDAQGVGDGNLNVIVLSTGDDGTLTAATRKTKRFFDFRDRLVTTVNPLRPHEALAYDNLDRVVERAIITTASASVTAAVDPSDETDRGLYSQTGYSQRGLRFVQRVAIDPSEADPGAGSGYLESHSWYDARGRTIASWMPNSPGTKRVYDAHSRTTAMYVTDRGGDALPGATGNHAAAAAVTGDTVLEQVEYDYTDDDLLKLVTSNYRDHDATSTGALSSSNAVTTYVGFVYDDADRRTHTVNYGTASEDNLFEAGGLEPAVPPTIVASPVWWENSTYEDQIITGVTYNRRGLVEGSIDGEGRTTRVVYDDLSRRIAVIENWKNATIAWATDRWQASDIAQNGTAGGNDERGTDRVTSFLYDGSSHVTHQMAHLWDGTTSTGANDRVQITEYVYNATTETTPDPSDLTENLVPSKDLLKEVRYPDESTGAAGTTNALKVRYAYNHLGELRSVIDQNGTTHGYVRDELGRVEQDEVTAFGTNIDQAVQSISVTYDSLSRLDRVRSWDGTDLGTADVLNAAQFTYTPLWQVEELRQDQNGDIASNSDGLATETLTYDYDTRSPASANGNVSRMDSVEDFNGDLRINQYSGDANDRISRVTEIVYSGSASGFASAYQYLGLGMVARLQYPELDVELDRSFSHDGKRRVTGKQAAGVYPGWDRFGRVQRQAWVDGGLTVNPNAGSGAPYNGVPNVPPILEQTYTYDRASNRETNIDARPGARIAYRDFEYVYDDLDRLIESRRGAWTGSAITPYASGSADLAKLAGQQWDYDLLGNWIQFRANLNGDSDYTDAPGDLQEDRTHNAANELTELTRDGGTTDLPFSYDDSGNMRSRDMGAVDHVYTHDAWNRLVKVEVDDGTNTPVAIGEYEYNGLHWRTVKRADADSTTLGIDQQRIMYYDASWRLIEEHIDDAFDGTHSDTRQAQQVWGIRYIDDAVLRRVREWVEIDPVNSPGKFDWSDWEHFWYVTDVQFSVMALLNETAEVVERVSYDAYGNARHRRPADLDGDGDVDGIDLASHPQLGGTDYFIGDPAYSADFDLNRDGSEDDIFDLLDYLDWYYPGSGTTAVSEGNISETDAAAMPNVAVAPDNPIGYCGYVFNPEVRLYHVRNRWYSPELGRWLERDFLDYADGAHLYNYLRSAPILYTDPWGLMTDPEAAHPYPLYLGGDPNQSCVQLPRTRHRCGKASHEQFIQNRLRALGATTREEMRAVWKGMSKRQQRTLLRDALESAGVDAKFISKQIDNWMKGAKPGVNRTGDRIRPKCVFDSKGGRIKGTAASAIGILAAIGAVQTTKAVGQEIDRDPSCKRLKQALQQFAKDPSNCAILDRAREDAYWCFLAIGEAVGGNEGGAICGGNLEAFDDLRDKCHSACPVGSPVSK